MDPRGRLLIHGYVRSIQTNDTGNVFKIIPMDIIELCHAFYLNEYFTQFGKKLIYYKPDNKISCPHNTYSSKPACAYGNIRISRENLGIFAWTFKLLFRSKRIYLGIDSSNKYCTNQGLSKKHTFYVFNDEYIYNHACKSKEAKQSYKSLHKWKRQDEIRMELNTKTKRLTYFYNEEEKGKTVCPYVDFLNNKMYHMVVYFDFEKGYSNGAWSVQLIDFRFTKLRK